MVKLHISLSLFLLAIGAICSYGHMTALGNSGHTRFEKIRHLIGNAARQNKVTAKKFVRDLTSSTAKNALDDNQNNPKTPSSPKKAGISTSRLAIRLANKVGLRCSAPTIMQEKSQEVVKKSLETVKQIQEEEKNKQLSTETYRSFLDKLFVACYKQVASLVTTVKNFSNLDFSGL